MVLEGTCCISCLFGSCDQMSDRMQLKEGFVLVDTVDAGGRGGRSRRWLSHLGNRDQWMFLLNFTPFSLAGDPNSYDSTAHI